MDKEEVFTIDLDCPPGYPRPSDLLPSVLKDTGLKIDPEDTVSRFFGNFTWKIPKEQSEQYKKNRELIKQRITDLYNRGVIRYGSW